MFKKLLNEGQAGDNVGLLLRGTKRDDVERGQVGGPVLVVLKLSPDRVWFFKGSGARAGGQPNSKVSGANP